MTLRELQYATQSLIDCGAANDSDELFVKVNPDNFAIYVRTEDDVEHIATIPAA